MKENLEMVKTLARDLRNDKEFPRSPREMLSGYVPAARAVDECRADLIGWQGEYYSNCPLDQRWLTFAEIDYQAFRSFIATGSSDTGIAVWIGEHAKKRSRQDIVVRNNREGDLRLSDLPAQLQERMEDYIVSFVPRIAWSIIGSTCMTWRRSVSELSHRTNRSMTSAVVSTSPKMPPSTPIMVSAALCKAGSPDAQASLTVMQR